MLALVALVQCHSRLFSLMRIRLRQVSACTRIVFSSTPPTVCATWSTICAPVREVASPLPLVLLTSMTAIFDWLTLDKRYQFIQWLGVYQLLQHGFIAADVLVNQPMLLHVADGLLADSRTQRGRVQQQTDLRVPLVRCGCLEASESVIHALIGLQTLIDSRDTSHRIIQIFDVRLTAIEWVVNQRCNSHIS